MPLIEYIKMQNVCGKKSIHEISSLPYKHAYADPIKMSSAYIYPTRYKFQIIYGIIIFGYWSGVQKQNILLWS